MTSKKNKVTILTESDKKWIAFKKGDKKTAKDMITSLSWKLLYGEEPTRTEKNALVIAMFYHKDNAEKFFGYGKRGRKPAPILEKIEIWELCNEKKEELKMIDQFH